MNRSGPGQHVAGTDDPGKDGETVELGEMMFAYTSLAVVRPQSEPIHALLRPSGRGGFGRSRLDRNERPDFPSSHSCLEFASKSSTCLVQTRV